MEEAPVDATIRMDTKKRKPEIQVTPEDAHEEESAVNEAPKARSVFDVQYAFDS